MTDSPTRPLVTPTGIITGAIAFALPIIADRLILAAMEQFKDVQLGSLIGMAVYTALPFLLLDSAMRPRLRVRIALWAGLALTTVLWMSFAYTGVAIQNLVSAEGEFKALCESVNMLPITESNPTNDLATPLGQTCLSFKNTINTNIGLFMITMAWPAILIVLMGAIAKIGEKAHAA